MGLIKAALGSAGGVLADQWKEYFYCEALPANVLVAKGQHKTSGRSSNTKGSENIISNGSVIAVADGQCMLIVEQGKVVDVCAEPGEYKYDCSTEPSIFTGGLGKGIIDSFKTLGKRFTFGGEAANDQRVYFFNTKEILGNKYGTPTPVPFRVVDRNIGLDMDTSIRCFGEYSYRISNPLLFYTNVCGNVSGYYTRNEIDNQLKTEILTALQPAFAQISEQGVRYAALPAHAGEMSVIMNQQLSATWSELRGIEIVSFGISSVTGNAEDEKTIKELQRNAAYRDPSLAAGALVGAQAQAMQDAAKNQGGAAMAFMGMNMAQQAGGINAQSLYGMAQQQPVQQSANTWTCPKCKTAVSGKFCPECGTRKPEPKIEGSWTCPGCGASATGKFCPECGTRKPEAAQGWTCPSCGATATGKFCPECGAKKPAGVPQYKCDKCGWVPEDPTNPPKFCPECGDLFGDEDLVK